MPLKPTPHETSPAGVPAEPGEAARRAKRGAGEIAAENLAENPAESLGAGARPTSKARKSRTLVLCPYCGEPTPIAARCGSCRGLLDSLSRQASQNAMGPWFIHDSANPFRPGCSYETVVAMAKRGKIERHAVMRGPTTKQFWCAATATPGVSHLFGVCYQCRADVQTTDNMCDDCGADFTIETDRQYLGLNLVEPLPGQAIAANESGIVSTAVGGGGVGGARGKRESAGLSEGGAGLASDDLTAAISVLSRRLRAQTRLVNGLATSVIALLVTLVGLGVWLTVDRASKMKAGMERQRPSGVAGPGVVGRGVVVDEVSELRSDVVPEESGGTKRGAETKALLAPVPVSAPELVLELVVDPAEQRIAALIATDTVESLTKALALLPAGGEAGGASAGSTSARRRAVEMRIEQLRLKELP